MTHSNIHLATRRYEYAKTVHSAVRQGIEKLIESGSLPGFELAPLSKGVSDRVQGFDLYFTDRCVRMVFTGSNLPQGHVAIECIRVPLAYGLKYDPFLAYLVNPDGSVRLKEGGNYLWLETPGDVLALLEHMVGEVNAPPGT